MVALDAMLQRIEREGHETFTKLNESTARLAHQLKAWWEQHGYSCFDAHHFGSLFTLRMPDELRIVFSQTLSCHGVYCGEGHTQYLSLAHTDDDIQRIVDAVQQTTRALESHNLLPMRSNSPVANQPCPDPPSFSSSRLVARHESLSVASGVPLEAYLRVSDLQLPLLVHQQLYPSSTAYNEPIAVPLPPGVPEHVVRATLQAVVRRHAALRTLHFLATPPTGPTALYQVILPEDGYVVPLTLCSSSSDWSATLMEELETPFLLSSMPPVRGCTLLNATASPGTLSVVTSPSHTPRLVLNVHHVCADGISMELIRAQILAHCSALVSHVRPPAPRMPSVEYADFALWEAARPFDDTALHWWTTQLHGAPELLSLPLRGPRPATQTTASSHVKFAMDRALTAHVISLCRTAGATVNAALLTAWAEVLHRTSRQSDIVVGMPHSMRHAAELRDVVGMFINTLPIRMARDDSRPLIAALGNTQRNLGRALQHAHVPLHRILAAHLGRRGGDGHRSAAYSPLFQLLFHVIGSHGEGVAASDEPWREEEWTVDEPTVKVDLEMEIIHSRETMQGKLIYDSGLFDLSAVGRWTGHLIQLLESTAPATAARSTTTHSIRLSELSMATHAEPEKTVHLLEGTSMDLISTLCLHALAEEALTNESTSDIALEWEGACMSKQALSDYSRRVASWLHTNAAVAPDHPVALQLHRSLEQVVGILGVLHSGAPYLPLDTEWPLERRLYMLKDAGCSSLLSQSMHVADGLACDILPLDRASDLPLRSTPMSLRVFHPSPWHLAYVMFTSGSTGRPKGVMVPHAGVVNLLLSAQQRYSSGMGSTFGVPTPYVFDVSIYNIFSSFAVFGGCCKLLRDGASLVMLREADALTHLAAVPSVLAVSRVPLSVRQVQVGGEALTQAAVKNVHASASIFNYYGPTEASVWATRCPVGRADQSTRLSSIGIALPNVRCYVVSNGSMPELLPPGSHGELWLGGVQLARGYLNRLDITAERFVSNPWAPSESTMDAIAYRTGDRVRWSSDSELDFAGCAEGEGSKPMEASA